jgi:hypothetical protein
VGVGARPGFTVSSSMAWDLRDAGPSVCEADVNEEDAPESELQVSRAS